MGKQEERASRQEERASPGGSCLPFVWEAFSKGRYSWRIEKVLRDLKDWSQLLGPTLWLGTGALQALIDRGPCIVLNMVVM